MLLMKHSMIVKAKMEFQWKYLLVSNLIIMDRIVVSISLLATHYIQFNWLAHCF